MRRRITILFRIAGSLTLLSILLWGLDWGQVASALSNADFRILPLAPLLILVNLLIFSLRWQILLKNAEYPRSIGFCIRAYLNGMSVGILMPGVLGGDVVRLGIAARNNVPVSVAAATIFIERLSGLLSLFVLGFIGATMVSPELLPGDQFITSFVWLSTAVAGLAGIFAVRLATRDKIEKWTPHDPGFFRQLVVSMLGFSTLPTKDLAAIFGASALGQACSIMAIYVTAVSLEITLPLYLFLYVAAVIYLGTVLPISVGGLGVREGILVYFLSFNDIPEPTAITLGFLVYANSIAIALINLPFFLNAPQTEDQIAKAGNNGDTKISE